MKGIVRRDLLGVITFAVMTGSALGEARQSFTVVNQTGHVIVTLNVSPQDSNRWGPDLLGSEVLANGESASVTLDNTEAECVWDIRIGYDDQTQNDERGVNLCEIDTVTFAASE